MNEDCLFTRGEAFREKVSSRGSAWLWFKFKTYASVIGHVLTVRYRNIRKTLIIDAYYINQPNNSFGNSPSGCSSSGSLDSSRSGSVMIVSLSDANLTNKPPVRSSWPIPSSAATFAWTFRLDRTCVTVVAAVTTTPATAAPDPTAVQTKAVSTALFRVEGQPSDPSARERGDQQRGTGYDPIPLS